MVAPGASRMSLFSPKFRPDGRVAVQFGGVLTARGRGGARPRREIPVSEGGGVMMLVNERRPSSADVIVFRPKCREGRPIALPSTLWPATKRW